MDDRIMLYLGTPATSRIAANARSSRVLTQSEVKGIAAVWASRACAGGTPWAELFALGLASQLGLLEHCSPILV